MRSMATLFAGRTGRATQGLRRSGCRPNCVRRFARDSLISSLRRRSSTIDHPLRRRATQCLNRCRVLGKSTPRTHPSSRPAGVARRWIRSPAAVLVRALAVSRRSHAATHAHLSWLVIARERGLGVPVLVTAATLWSTVASTVTRSPLRTSRCSGSSSALFEPRAAAGTSTREGHDRRHGCESPLALRGSYLRSYVDADVSDQRHATSWCARIVDASGVMPACSPQLVPASIAMRGTIGAGRDLTTHEPTARLSSPVRATAQPRPRSLDLPTCPAPGTLDELRSLRTYES